MRILRGGAVRNQQDLVRLLKKEGHDVTQSSVSRDLRDLGVLKARGGYDAVLMDVTLPILDGLAATRKIRELPGAAGRIPVIGISGKNEASDESAARAAGMSDYLVKPVSPARLSEALKMPAG